MGLGRSSAEFCLVRWCLCKISRGRQKTLSWSCLSSHCVLLLELGELCRVWPGGRSWAGPGGRSPDLCEPWDRLLDGADALSQVTEIS